VPDERGTVAGDPVAIRVEDQTVDWDHIQRVTVSLSVISPFWTSARSVT
jgi:hypothetical protein